MNKPQHECYGLDQDVRVALDKKARPDISRESSDDAEHEECKGPPRYFRRRIVRVKKREETEQPEKDKAHDAQNLHCQREVGQEVVRLPCP